MKNWDNINWKFRSLALPSRSFVLALFYFVWARMSPTRCLHWLSSLTMRLTHDSSLGFRHLVVWSQTSGCFFSAGPNVHLCGGVFWLGHLVGIFVYAFQSDALYHQGNSRSLGQKDVFLIKLNSINCKYKLSELHIGPWQYPVDSNIPFLYVGIMFWNI